MKRAKYLITTVLTALCFTIAVPAAPILTAHAAASKTAEQKKVSSASIYRGTVTEIAESDNGTLVKLSQAEGTDYGSPSLLFRFTKNTKLSDQKKEIQKGDYLEVSYRSTKSLKLGVQEAVSVKMLQNTNLSVFNGKVIKITKNQKNKKTGSILLKDLKTNQETLFRFSENTKCSVPVQDIKVGSLLNIYHSGMLTRSIPPQGNAMEINKYADIEVYRGTLSVISIENKQTTLTIKRVSGSPYDNNTLKLRLTQNTKLNISQKDLKSGMFLEVSYNPSEKIKAAASIEKLYPKEAMNYNGTVTEIQKDENNAGTITLTDLNGENETVFHYSSSTKFNIDVNKIKVGTKLHLYHKGISTMSLPPQCYALEISSYKK